jgi:hypothetical protein
MSLSQQCCPTPPPHLRRLGLTCRPFPRPARPLRRCRLISLANKEYSKGDMSPWMIWRTDWLWHSAADKADRGSDILADWLRESALEFESGAERWLFVGVQVVHDRVRQQ